MLTQLRARLADRPADEGISLIEVLVAMALSTIVMAITLNFFVGSLRFSDTTTSDSINTAQARNVLDSWSQLIRLADSPVAPGTSIDRFAQIGEHDLVFYANLGNRSSTDARTAPTKIWLSIDNGQLIERRYPALNPDADPALQSYTYPDPPTVTRILAGCTSGTSTACATPGTVSSSAGFVAYYPATGCPGGALSANGLCSTDPNDPPSVQDAVAVSISFTMRTVNGAARKGFTTLASVSGGAQ